MPPDICFAEKKKSEFIIEQRILSGIEITISDNQNVLSVDRLQVEQTVRHVLQKMNVSKAEVSLALVDDEVMRKLNEKYLQDATPTDVISFDLGDTDASQINKLDCEVIVNAQCALRVTREHTGNPQAELNLYIVHGLLHHLGYNDQTKKQAKTMHEMENQLLEELGFGNVFGGTG